MLDPISFLAAPFIACLILVVILGYLGLHVLLRNVIFVDLALAQIAALGAVIAFYLGHEPGTLPSFLMSLLAALVGAAIFSWSRTRREKIPQEAIIGITYVIASAGAILVADRAPEGAEHIKELLAGAIIWVSWSTVVKDLIICGLVGLAHFFLRKKFILISEDPERAFDSGISVRWWDFLFYALFGLVITVSVEIAGVLMVFAFLVAPSIIALASSDSWPRRLLLAWSVGLLGSLAGLVASYHWDLPSGPSIICALGVLLLLFVVCRRLRPRSTAAA